METEFAATDAGDGTASASGQVKSEEQPAEEVKDLWDAMHQRPPAPHDAIERTPLADDVDHSTLFDDLSEPVIVKVWGRVFETDHNHLFGDCKLDAPLSSLHPSHVQIFRLWQTYSDNINPLLKVTHTPTLQARILDAAVDVTNISRDLEALMFSIYCTAIITMSEEDCQFTLGGSKVKLLKKYQDACRQALINCGFLRSRERDCLTAFFLYLVGRTANDTLYAAHCSRFL